MENKYILSIGCHKGTLMSRDSDARFFDTHEAAYKSYEESKSFWNSIGYKVWFAVIIHPDGKKRTTRK